MRLLLAVLALASCERTTSDPPRPIGRELFRGLPGGQTIAFAARHVKAADDKMMLPCLGSGREVRVAGGIVLELPRVVARAVIDDTRLAELVPCARRAGVAITADSDGKRAHLSITMPGGVAMSAELAQLPSDRVLLRLDIDTAAAPYFQPISAAAIDADLAALAKRSTADDGKLMTLIERADRRQPVVYACDGSRTPIASWLGDVYGSADITGDDFSVDLTAQIIDAELADRFERRAKEVQAQKVVAELAVSREGDRIHVVGRASFAQTRALQRAMAGN
jgi:hypothetical protein